MAFTDKNITLPPQTSFPDLFLQRTTAENFMFQISYDEVSNLVTAITSSAYDAEAAKEQMHQILNISNLPGKIRVLRIFRNVTFSLSPADMKEHFAYVQDQLNHTHIKNCSLAIVTDDPRNTALGFLYKSNKTAGSCSYMAHVFSTEKAATKWLMEN